MKMRPIERPFNMVRGDTGSLVLTAYPRGFLTGDKVAMMVKPQNDDNPVITKEVTEFINGEAVIAFNPADTDDLVPGIYYYDIRVVWNTGAVQTIIKKSDFNLLEDITDVV